VVAIQKEVERLGGIFSSKIDGTVGSIIHLQDIFSFAFFHFILI
jgi:hypothetical protein